MEASKSPQVVCNQHLWGSWEFENGRIFRWFKEITFIQISTDAVLRKFHGRPVCPVVSLVDRLPCQPDVPAFGL